MAERIKAQIFHDQAGRIPVIDVRSPGEYQTGHIPGSINLSLLDDSERAAVGTTYKQSGREKAIEQGLEFIGPKMAGFVRFARTHAPDGQWLVYCWRGGMRSGSMAWLLETAGLNCQVLEGGYKAYRQYGKRRFNEHPEVLVLGGFTGSGKTHVLKAMVRRGEQVLDIEQAARHRGSSFGAIGQESQRTNEQFENQLIFDWLSMDPSRRIWIEDESRILGKNHIPEPLYERIRQAPVFALNIDREIRAANLVADYAGLEKGLLEAAIRRIERKLGGQQTKEALQALDMDDFQTVARISLVYYDQTYAFGLSRRDPASLTDIRTDSQDPEKIADLVLQAAQKTKDK